MIEPDFGARLRHERERRGIALASIADQTKIAPALLVALERGDVTHWPGGIYRRAFIRAYAGAVGLDPNQIAREFFERFPEPVEASAADVHGAPIPLLGSFTTKPFLPDVLPHVLVRIDRPPDLCRGGPVLVDARQRIGAAAADLAILLLTAIGFSLAIGYFWMPLAIAMVCYYAGGILILGNTAGICLFAALAGDDPPRTTAHGAPVSAGARSAT
jgi:transcriptional regulator with XRE-family HTH domain